MRSITFCAGTIIVLTLVAGCPSSPFDASKCNEYIPIAVLDEGALRATVDVDSDAVVVSVGGQSVSYPRVPSAGDFRGRVFDGLATATVDEHEDGAVLELRTPDGELLVHAGVVDGIPDDVPAVAAASFAVQNSSALCTADPSTGRFSGVEFRTIDPPLTLAAGREQVVAIGQRQHLAGVPWAFVTSENTFSGSAYFVRLE